MYHLFWSFWGCAVLSVLFSFTIILLGRREPLALLRLSSGCHVIVSVLSLQCVIVVFPVFRVSLQCVIVVFPGHTHLLLDQ